VWGWDRAWGLEELVAGSTGLAEPLVRQYMSTSIAVQG